MRARRPAGAAHLSKDITTINPLARRNLNDTHVGVESGRAVAMINHHPVAVAPVVRPAGYSHGTAVGSQNRAAAAVGDIDSLVIKPVALRIAGHT